MFSCEFCEISQNTFFTEHVRATDFVGELSIFQEYFAKVKECSTFNNKNQNIIISVPIKLDSEDQKQSPSYSVRKSWPPEFRKFHGKAFVSEFRFNKVACLPLVTPTLVFFFEICEVFQNVIL